MNSNAHKLSTSCGRRVSLLVKMPSEFVVQWRNPNFWNSLAHYAFEREVAQLFSAAGWDTEHCGQTRDGGIDIRISKSGVCGFVQCKRHVDPVGVAVVREIYGVACAYGAKAILVATGGFTLDAVEFAKTSGVRLLEVQELIRLAEEAEDLSCSNAAEQEPSRLDMRAEWARFKAQEDAEFERERSRVAAEVATRDEEIEARRVEREAEDARRKEEWIQKNMPTRSRVRRQPKTARDLIPGDRIFIDGFDVVQITTTRRLASPWSNEGRVLVQWTEGEFQFFETGLIDCRDWVKEVIN